MALLASAAFSGAKRAVLELWARLRPEEVTSIAAELEATRTTLTQGAQDDQAVQDLAQAWQRRLAPLLSAESDAAALRRALAAADAPQEQGPATGVRMTAEAHHGNNFQAGRDQYVIGR